MNKLNKELKEQAIGLGLCGQWAEEWNKSWNADELAKRMFSGITFCMRNNYPGKDFLLQHFDSKTLIKNNVIIDCRHSLLNPKNSLLMGDAESTIRFNGLSFGRVYLRDGSKATLTAKGRSFVIVHLYDNASINVAQSDIAKVSIVVHSSTTQVEISGRVKVVNRMK